jgi:hypothetical protein
MEYAAELHRRSSAFRARSASRDSASGGLRTRPTAELAMQAMAVEFPLVHGHPNRLPFEGVLTLVDVASDKAPSGARGHRVVLSRAAAEAALPRLLGMAVDYKAGWDGHDARQKCGIITSACTTPPRRHSTRDFQPPSSPTCRSHRQRNIRSKPMTDFEGRVLADLSVLKSQMKEVFGNGQPGRLALLENRMREHEKTVQRIKGMAGAFGGLLTFAHIAIDCLVGRR